MCKYQIHSIQTKPALIWQLQIVLMYVPKFEIILKKNQPVKNHLHSNLFLYIEQKYQIQ